MGDLIGTAVEGTLYYAGAAEFERVRSLNADAPSRAEVYAGMARLNALYMIANAGSGHIGSSFSSLDLVSWIYLNELASEEDKEHLIDCLYAVATADSTVSVIEDEEIRSVSRALLLSHSQFIAIRSRYKEQLAVIQALRKQPRM